MDTAKTEMNMNWNIVIWLGVIHAVAILGAYHTFTWLGLYVMIGLILATGFGVTVGYHRLLTHDSFQTYYPIRIFLAWLGSMSGEGSAVFWVANHRKHHQFSDLPEDPHSPRKGFRWAHYEWMILRNDREVKAIVAKYAKDLRKEPWMMFLHYTFPLWHLLLAIILGVAGYYIDGWKMCASFLVWGIAIRMAFVLHSTWFVNSASHMWGYRTYDTDDDSRNNWWVALLSLGEGWHNNHHAFQRSARHGHKLWEIDPTYMVIKLLKFLHLAWDVQEPKASNL